MLRFVSCLLWLSVGTASGNNPFLRAESDQPVTSIFRGTEWGDDFEEEEVALEVRVTTTRLALMPWGGLIKIEFQPLRSKRQIDPLLFLATPREIVLVPEADPAAAAKRIASLTEAPTFEPQYFYGISQGARKYEDPPWKTVMTAKGANCTYSSSHPSGHFTRLSWRKGVGLVEYASGQGARADGFRLKRAAEGTR